MCLNSREILHLGSLDPDSHNPTEYGRHDQLEILSCEKPSSPSGFRTLRSWTAGFGNTEFCALW